MFNARDIFLSVIIPAFNEEKEVRDNTRAVEQKLDSLRLNYEIILVNDGSADGTLSRMQECAGSRIKVLSYEKNRGKGFAVRHGMLHAAGRYRLFMDADLSTSLEAMDKFLEHMRQDDYDMIIGDRKSKPGDHTVKQPWHRRFLGNGFIVLSRWCVEKKIRDFTCGFKMFNRRAADIIFKKQQILNWAFDTELIAIALIHDLRIGEIPVTWNHHHGSAVRPMRNIFTSLAGLLKIKWNILQGVYR
ncbi:MAG TPA: dolichyl-phosphate beta-glucosyltransferase [Candidatus Omnitrophota bacterium]|nr:dolichyl-phosphate beta-glucosyltransferase [Candidatus Omnitrophota bacterium]